MDNENTLRVHVDDLFWDDYILYFAGRPFTGVCYDTTTTGTLWSEETYDNGFRHGASRSWHENTQQLSTEDCFKVGRLDGFHRSWFRNGQLGELGFYELGHCLWQKAWDEAGVLLKDFTLGLHEEEYARLERARLSEDAYVARWHTEAWKRAKKLFPADAL